MNLWSRTRTSEALKIEYPGQHTTKAVTIDPAMQKRLLLIFISGWILLMGYSGDVMGQDDDSVKSLAPCGTKPNCVSSQNTSDNHKVAPFRLDGSGRAAIEKIEEILSALPGATITQSEGLYLHAEFKSRVFGFVDDVEFLADEKENRVHVRSASRLGYSDFGVNRRRVEKIRTLYDKE